MKIIPISNLGALDVRANHPLHTAAVECACGCVFVPEKMDSVTCPNCKAEGTPTRTSEVIHAP